MFSSGQGPARSKPCPRSWSPPTRRTTRARDLAFLIVKGVKQPPAPINMLNRLDPTAGMAYLAPAFRLRSARETAADSTGQSLSHDHPRSVLRRSCAIERGQLTSLRMDEGLIPGDGGWPIVEERTGTLIGVAVTASRAARAIPAGLSVTEVGLSRTDRIL